jgi:drug/metabolite transporter (DMT)-like permease
MTHDPHAALPFILASVGSAVLAQVCLKSAMIRVGRVGRTTSRRHWRQGASRLVLGLCLYGVSTFMWLSALALVELSFAFPFISLSYVGIMLAARMAFGEAVTRPRLLGSALIVAGVLLVSLSG